MAAPHYTETCVWRQCWRLTKSPYRTILYGMARKNIIAKTVYIPEESLGMWDRVREYLDLDSESAVLWNLIQNKFHEIKDGKGKRQAALETLSIVEVIQANTTDMLQRVANLEYAAKVVQAELAQIKAALAEHGFDVEED